MAGLFLISFAGALVLMALIGRHVLLSTPTRIVRRLQRRGRLAMHLSIGEIVWDPAKPYPAPSGAMGPGRAVWTLEGESIHVVFKSWFGEHLDSRGPIPQAIIHPSAASLRNRRRIRKVALGYLGTLLIGFVVGYSVSSGSIASRIGWGICGGVLTMVLIALFGQGLLVARSVNTLAKGDAVQSRDRSGSSGQPTANP